MASDIPVIWTVEAEDNLDELRDFLLQRWTNKEVFRMLQAIKACESIIAKHPEAFKESSLRPGCRLALAHPNLTMVYRYEAEQIVVVALFDNRADDPFR